MVEVFVVLVAVEVVGHLLVSRAERSERRVVRKAGRQLDRRRALAVRAASYRLAAAVAAVAVLLALLS